jgi:hypothetical protein
MCRLAAVNRWATPSRGKIHSIGHSGQTGVPPVGGRSVMIRTGWCVSALVSAHRHGTPSEQHVDTGAPSEHPTPIMWKIAAHLRNESRP